MRRFSRLAFALAFVLFASVLWAGESDEAFNARLFQDWTMQDEPDEARRASLFQTADGAAPERTVVERVLAELAEREVDASELRARLDDLVASNAPGSDPRWVELYRSAHIALRAARLDAVAEQAPSFVYTKHYVIGASHYAYTEDVSDEAYRDYSKDRREGGQLCLATFMPDGSIRSEVLVDAGVGTLRDPDVSWDGQKILFSMRRNLFDDDFHLYEYDVATKETRQLTFGKGVADIEPIYLPNDDILFGSTRCGQITDCWWTEVSNFYVCDKDGRFPRRISVDQVTVNYPKLLDDGRVVYTRWDYNDRGQIFPQPLFQMNADGTGQTEYYGNNSYFPTTILHARGIPGGDKVVAIAAGHHTYQHGKLLLIDRSKGSQENNGATLIAPVRETPAERIDAYGQGGELFQYPYPLDEESALVAYLPEGSMGRTYKVPFGVYWFDFDGRRELLAFDPTISCGQPIPLVERERPTLRPSQVDLTQTTGKYYVQDVYEGPGLAGIERGTIAALRVVALEFRPVGVRKNGNGGASGAAMVCTPVSIGNGTWDVKHVLGTVPVEEDGSAYFEVPALTPVYFQLLDKNGDVVQTMRSWSTLQPGETFGCVGCHEPKEASIANAAAAIGSTTAALRKGVAQLTPELTPGEGWLREGGMSFVRDIQPILDDHCVSCHTGGTRADGSAAPFSLLGNRDVSARGLELSEKEGRFYSEAYLNLVAYGDHAGPYVDWLDVQAGPELLPPYAAGAAKSPLIALFRDAEGNVGGQDENHRDVKLDARSLRTIALWIDMLVPFCGDYTEEANWTDEEIAKFRYYTTKKYGMAQCSLSNYESKKALAGGAGSFLGAGARETGFGGCDDLKLFQEGFQARKVPSAARRAGKLNVYRNLAVNPTDVQGDAIPISLYPHATSNSEYARMDAFAAKNAIDGRKENRGHGPAFPSWGPNKRTDLWLNVDFGCEVEIDKAVVYLRADFPHDGVWTTGTLEFSDGSRVNIELKETAEPQTFQFAKRRVRSVKLTNLKADEAVKWKGVSEIEYWGVSVD